METENRSVKSTTQQEEMQQTRSEIRVLIVVTHLAIGGATNVVLEIAQYLNQNPRFTVHLAVGPAPEDGSDLTFMAHEQAIPITVIPHLNNHINPWTNLRAITALSRLMIAGRYDIVHTHSSVAGVLGRMAAFVARIPVVLHHVHGWGLQEGMSRQKRLLYLNLERLCARFTDRLIAVSRPDIQKGLEHRICREDKFTLIYNGIDLEQYRQEIDEQKMRSELGLAPDSKLVGMIGRLETQKNPIDFVRAAAIVAKDHHLVQFLIVGDGSLRPECERMIRELNLQDRFFLLGYRNDVANILPMLSLTVMSSLWEGLPIVFAESMSAGKPIVANNVDGVSDVVIDGETGYLVTPHFPEEMAARVSTLLSDDKGRHRMGATARQHSERFSDRQMHKKIDTLYGTLIAAKLNLVHSRHRGLWSLSPPPARRLRGRARPY